MNDRIWHKWVKYMTKATYVDMLEIMYKEILQGCQHRVQQWLVKLLTSNLQKQAEV
jgi:hypothetical protein